MSILHIDIDFRKKEMFPATEWVVILLFSLFVDRAVQYVPSRCLQLIK